MCSEQLGKKRLIQVCRYLGPVGPMVIGHPMNYGFHPHFNSVTKNLHYIFVDRNLRRMAVLIEIPTGWSS